MKNELTLRDLFACPFTERGLTFAESRYETQLKDPCSPLAEHRW